MSRILTGIRSRLWLGHSSNCSATPFISSMLGQKVPFWSHLTGASPSGNHTKFVQNCKQNCFTAVVSPLVDNGLTHELCDQPKYYQQILQPELYIFAAPPKSSLSSGCFSYLKALLPGSYSRSGVSNANSLMRRFNAPHAIPWSFFKNVRNR